MKETVPAFIRPSLAERFEDAYDRCRVILFSAPCGCGKTTTARHLLRGKSVQILPAQAVEDPAESLAPETEAVILDDLQTLTDPAGQQAVCRWIQAYPRKKFLLLSRGPLPGWLMPFQFAGVMETFEVKDLLLDAPTAKKMLEAAGPPVSGEELAAIQREIKGFPVALAILCRYRAGGEKFHPGMLEQVKRELFLYFDEMVFRRFDKPLRALLLAVVPFDRFTADMAKTITGDPEAGERLGRLLRETSMVLCERVDVYQIYPIFREFLAWEAAQQLTPEEERERYHRAGVYYELAGDLPRALECYSQSGSDGKVSALLEKHAQLHPGVGHYYETEPYYRALPREAVLRSPALLCGMSMLCALTMDFAQSEAWYRELQAYGTRLKKTDLEYREVRAKLAYLDISLPQRGSKGLIELIRTVFAVMTDKQMIVPAVSVTSMLPSIMNGGKDFCEWSKQDDLLYVTMRRPVEAVLGRDGVGLADCALCESKLEKGEDISGRLLRLVARLGEIQNRGTPDIEFAVIGLLARQQVLNGDAASARKAVEALRERFSSVGQERFLPNMDALLCRIDLRLGENTRFVQWQQEKAPKDALRLRALWRYQYLTLAMTQIAQSEYGAALLVLAPLLPYCETCGRNMDWISVKLLMALCAFRMENEDWKTWFCQALDRTYSYRFITPVSQWGAPVLPLLTDCGWKTDEAYRSQLLTAARAQAVYYPGFLKSASVLSEPLTATETQVLRLLCHDLSNQEIGEILGIKLATVKTHVSHVLQKLGVSRRSEAKTAAERLHLQG